MIDFSSDEEEGDLRYTSKTISNTVPLKRLGSLKMSVKYDRLSKSPNNP